MKEIIIASKRKRVETLKRDYPDAVILDVTSKSECKLVQFSPFYPHCDIPVPFSEGITASCVEAIWQGLKVFRHEGINKQLFANKTMKNMKRTVRVNGEVLGHQKGIFSKELLGYLEARRDIYLPSYKWVLENKLQDLVEELRKIAEEKDIVLLDYETNCDVNAHKPLSHAYLIKAYLEGNWPEITIE